MRFGLILGGGIGHRMGSELPKQFHKIGGQEIILYSVQVMLESPEIDEVFVLVPEAWLSYTRGLCARLQNQGKPFTICEGGETRNETIMNGIKKIEEMGQLDEQTIIVTHDAARPFLSGKMIQDNIRALQGTDAVDTVVPAVDTIVSSDDSLSIDAIPDRSKLYHGQTPQSFRAVRLRQLYESLSPSEKETLTDAAKIFVLKGDKVAMVQGDHKNIKITYPYDIILAESILKGGETN